jgi:hypothetical protein
LLSKSEPCNHELWAAPAITADLGKRHRRWRSQSSLYEQIDLPDGLRRTVCLDEQSQELHAADDGDARMTKIVVPFDGNCMWWVSERFQVAAQQIAMARMRRNQPSMDQADEHAGKILQTMSMVMQVLDGVNTSPWAILLWKFNQSSSIKHLTDIQYRTLQPPKP